MVGRYEISQGTGTVTVEKQGLYYHFSCRCRLSGEVMHRLVVTTDAGRVDLGVCVPMEGQFGIERKVPCKRFGKDPSFQLLPKHEGMQGRFVPIYPDEPFAYMTKLKDAFLATLDGQVGVVIKDEAG